MKNPFVWIVVVLGIAGTAAIFYHRMQREVPAVQAPPTRAEAPAPPTDTKAEPPILHPIEPAKDAKPLPALTESDTALRESLTAVVGAKPFAEYFYPADIIRRIVATVDNLPREKVALRLMPVKPVAGKFAVSGDGENFLIAPDNAARYTAYVQLMEKVDTGKLVSAYAYFYPLFQQAYKELGYPNRYFNDRLVEVIDHLLATPDMQGPVKLVRPKVFYEFADPKLEQASAGRKIMIRMGPDNAARVKTKLKEIRQALTSQGPKQ